MSCDRFTSYPEKLLKEQKLSHRCPSGTDKAANPENLLVQILEPLPYPGRNTGSNLMMGFTDSDGGDLLHRFRAGDEEAFAAIYRLHSPHVFRFALHMTGDRGKATEITQDVFVWLIHHPSQFDPARGGLSAFLIGVSRKLLMRRQQDERRWIRFSDLESTSAQRFADSSSTPPDLATSRTAELRRAIGTLPPRYREVLVLCDLEGRTYEEAASALECATGTVRSRLHRARQLLTRKLLGKRIGERCPA